MGWTANSYSDMYGDVVIGRWGLSSTAAVMEYYLNGPVAPLPTPCVSLCTLVWLVW